MTSIYIKQDTVLPERHKNDLYITEKPLIHAAMKAFAPRTAGVILDVGAGEDARWGVIAQDYTGASFVVGVDIENYPRPDGVTTWYPNQDFLTWNWEETQLFNPDLIVSNPPYFLAEEIIRKSFDILSPGGTMIFLLRLAFLEGVNRYKKLWDELPLNYCGVLSRRPSFYGKGKTNGTAFGIFTWKKGWGGKPVGTSREWPTKLIIYERDKDVNPVVTQKKSLHEYFLEYPEEDYCV